MVPYTIRESLIKLMPQPSPVKLVRIGGSKDGAYLVPDDLDAIQACFSPGVNNFKDFEDELTLKYGIKCHMCDYTSDLEKFKTPLINGMQTFEKKWLDIDGGADSISLAEWVEKSCGTSHDDLLLQMDIEGAELRNLNGASVELMNRFRILLLELHVPACDSSQMQFGADICQLIDKLYETHACVHIRANNCCGDFIDGGTGMNIPNVMEITYLRRDRFTGEPRHMLPPQLPHPLDIPFNLPQIQPLHLNSNWLGGRKRSLKSELKIYQDYIIYESESQPRIISLDYLRKGLLICKKNSFRDLSSVIYGFRLLAFHIRFQIKNLMPLLSRRQTTLIES